MSLSSANKKYHSIFYEKPPRKAISFKEIVLSIKVFPNILKCEKVGDRVYNIIGRKGKTI